jgi:hypothetical protein
MARTNPKKDSIHTHIKDLLLLFAIPIAITLFAAAAIYIPRLLANPKYDFIYSICENYECNDSFEVNGSGIVYATNDEYIDNRTPVADRETIRIYDVSDNSSRSLSLDEAKKYRLDKSSKSPDGYKIEHESTNSSLLFVSNHSEGWYLKNGAMKKEIDLQNNSPSYYETDNIKLLGWVTE